MLKKACSTMSLLIVAGCVSLPKEEQRENLISPPSVNHTMQTSLSTGFFTQGDWPHSHWWEIFADPTLNALISEALSQDPSLQSAQSRVEFAKQTAKVTRSTLFPLLFFDFNESWEYLSHNGLYRALNPRIPINANLVDFSLSS